MSSKPSAPVTTTGARVATGSPSRSGAHVHNDPGSANQTSDADNTKLNERDRQGAPTPATQGNSRDETKITAAIRRDVTSDKSLSFTAKNVKIITVGTKVTLRGPVRSDAERSAIEAHARQAPGVTDVDDQLEIKK
jgi:osmotically-inducible protein OsmY